MSSMTLINRGHYSPIASQDLDSAKDETKKNTRHRLSSTGALLILMAFVAFALFHYLESKSASASHKSARFDICPGVRLHLDFAKDMTDHSDAISLGDHHVAVTVKNGYKDFRVWMRITGDALVGVLLEESSKGHWKGTFSLPIEGSYQVALQWTGCNGKNTSIVTSTPIEVVARGQRGTDHTKISNRFPDSAWIASKKFGATNATISQPYIWIDRNVAPKASSLSTISNSVLAMEGTLGENKTYSFNQLSNYEIVCWIGGESGKKLISSFLELRPQVAKGQRPFKFHYHEIHSFVNPARDWPEEDAKRFRKCKHVLISLDELESPVSQTEYRGQVLQFITHLLKAFPDETFPIWMISVMESPTVTGNCHTPVLQRTSDHPCNIVLKDLFRANSFPDRVQLLDNTDLSLPMANLEDIVAVVALRLFVLVGKRVQEWRAAGQVGISMGLKRGGEVEPNFELVPYTDWNT